MTREAVERIRDWVERGGTFVAFPFTGRSTPDKVDAWPISALTGCRVKAVLYAIPDADANFDERPVRFGECRLDCF